MLKLIRTIIIIIVLVPSGFFAHLTVHAASRVSLSFSPTSGSYEVGDIFSEDILVGSPDQPINAISGTISFPYARAEVVSLSKANSILSIWLQEPTFSNTLGTVSFEGVALNPGFQGQSGTVLTVYFRIIGAGNIPLSFVSASVLANDGNGTPLPAKLGKATFSARQTASGVMVGSQESNSPIVRGEGQSLLPYGLTAPEVAVSFAALFFFAGLFFWYRRGRPSTGNKSLREELREARQSLHKTSHSLREGVEDKVKRLEKAGSGEQFVEEERKVIKQLEKDFETLESLAEKKIDDIEGEVK